MKIRVLNGQLTPYTRKSGSWDEANPDPASFEVEVGVTPVKGHYLVYHLPETNERFIGLIDDVILVGVNTYVFISSSIRA